MHSFYQLVILFAFVRVIIAGGNVSPLYYNSFCSGSQNYISLGIPQATCCDAGTYVRTVILLDYNIF